MEIKAPAKINLYLNVGQKRKDSFHDIISIMVKVSLWDVITIGKHEDIIIEGPDWLSQEENLAYKAAKLLKDYTRTDKGCRIQIKKNIPPKRGLGGGSSDCGAVLNALNSFWQLSIETKELEEIGKELGSDVNFFLHPGNCVVTGRGETIIPLGNIFKGTKNIIIIDTDIEISTKDVYEKYRNGKLTEKQKLNKIITDYKEGNWVQILKNDLEDIVFREFPILKNLKSRLINWGTYPLLCGSGSCIFALVDDKNTAESISQIINEDFEYNTWIVNPI